METSKKNRASLSNVNVSVSREDPEVALAEKMYILIKRMFDIMGAVVASVLLLVPMLIIAILIRMDSKGPSIFAQERLGRDGRPFLMYKFRTMQLDAEVNGPQWAIENDSRTTRLGKFLRKSRLDELPQLINIFLGEMSFVGPRPERACFYDKFDAYIPNFRARLQVPQGLTGHAQVNGGYDLRPEEKLVYDLEYIANRGIWMDLQCLLKTVRVVFLGKGAR